MKKTTLLALFLTVSLLGYAQEYQPMLKSGRVWVMNWSNGFYHGEEDHALKDTIISNALFFQDYCTRSVIEDGTGELVVKQTSKSWHYSEEDGKVYVYRNNDKYLLYDFTLRIGDSRQVNNSITQQVIWEDTILVRNRYYHRLYLLETGLSEKVPTDGYQDVVVWVEGVGSVWGLYKSYHDFKIPGGSTIFVGLYEGDELIFTERDFYAPPVLKGTMTSVENPKAQTFGVLPPHIGKQIFDLQGRRLKEAPEHSVVIEDGRKKVLR